MTLRSLSFLYILYARRNVARSKKLYYIFESVGRSIIAWHIIHTFLFTDLKNNRFQKKLNRKFLKFNQPQTRTDLTERTKVMGFSKTEVFKYSKVCRLS